MKKNKPKKKNAEKCAPKTVHPENLGSHAKSTFKLEYCEKLIQHFKSGGILENFGIFINNTPYWTVVQWLKDKPEFSVAHDLAIQHGLTHWLESKDKSEKPYYMSILRNAFKLGTLALPKNHKRMSAKELDEWCDKEMAEGNITLEQMDAINRRINSKLQIDLSQVMSRMDTLEEMFKQYAQKNKFK